jgi:hypothetical protein
VYGVVGVGQGSSFLAEFTECHPLHVANKYSKGVTFPEIRPKSRNSGVGSGREWCWDI